MNDHEAIRRLLADYCFGTDNGDTEGWIATMTDDVVWDGGAFGGFEGKDAARAYHQGAGDAALGLQHINTNHLIDIDGDRATVKSYIQVHNCSEQGAPIMFAGYYHDELVKLDGRWLIRRRTLAK